MTGMNNKVRLRGKTIVSVLGFLNRRNEGDIWKTVQVCVGEGEARRGQMILIGSHIEKKSWSTWL
jgi:hypothetical protein